MLVLFFDKENSKVLNSITNLKIKFEQSHLPDWVNTGSSENKSKCDEALLLIIKCYDYLLTIPTEIRNFQEYLINEFNLFLAKLIIIGGFQISKSKIISTAIFLLENPEAMKALKLNEERVKYSHWPNKDEVTQCL